MLLPAVLLSQDSKKRKNEEESSPGEQQELGVALGHGPTADPVLGMWRPQLVEIHQAVHLQTHPVFYVHILLILQLRGRKRIKALASTPRPCPAAHACLGFASQGLQPLTLNPTGFQNPGHHWAPEADTHPLPREAWQATPRRTLQAEF